MFLTAEPLHVELDLGCFRVEDGWAWGMRAKVSAATLYDVFDGGCEEQWMKIKATYGAGLCVPIVGKGAGEGFHFCGAVVNLCEPPLSPGRRRD